VPKINIKLFATFRESGAVGEENAKTLDEIGSSLTPFMQKRLFNKPLKMQIAGKRIFNIGDKYYLAEKYSKLPIEKLLDMFKSEEEQ